MFRNLLNSRIKSNFATNLNPYRFVTKSSFNQNICIEQINSIERYSELNSIVDFYRREVILNKNFYLNEHYKNKNIFVESDNIHNVLEGDFTDEINDILELETKKKIMNEIEKRYNIDSSNPEFNNYAKLINSIYYKSCKKNSNSSLLRTDKIEQSLDFIILIPFVCGGALTFLLFICELLNKFNK